MLVGFMVRITFYEQTTWNVSSFAHRFEFVASYYKYLLHSF